MTRLETLIDPRFEKKTESPPAKILILTNNRGGRGGEMAAYERTGVLLCKKERNARGGLIDDVREERKGCALSTRARAPVFRN